MAIEPTELSSEQLAARLLSYADDIEREGRSHAPAIMREAGRRLSDLGERAAQLLSGLRERAEQRREEACDGYTGNIRHVQAETLEDVASELAAAFELEAKP